MNEEKADLWKNIQTLDTKMEEDGYQPLEMIDKRKELLANIEYILRCEDIHQSQKAKCQWIKEGDGNTKFFHRVANGKKRKGIMAKLYIEGETVDNFDTMRSLFIFMKAFMLRSWVTGSSLTIYSICLRSNGCRIPQVRFLCG